MKLVHNLTVRGKLALAFTCVLLLMALLGAFSLLQLWRVHDQGNRVIELRLPGVRDSLAMAEAATRLRTREYRLVLTPADAVPAVIARIDEQRQVFEAARKSYAGAIADDDERQLYEQAMRDWGAYAANTEQVVAAMRDGRVDEARTTLLGEGVRRFDVAAASFKALAKYNDTHAGEDAARADTLFARSKYWVLGVITLAIAAAMALGLTIARAIVDPLRDAVALAEAVAAGDLTRSVSAHGRDEVAQLLRAMASMVERLRVLVADVRAGVEQVSTASSQIATGNIDLSQRTEEQASSLQQTAASMEQLTSTVSQNAESARLASELAAGATEVATRGGTVVGDVVTTMHSITDSSRRIADIISVIDGIAFQTNILALNAAVEAARAGEQGRGFAVVASEVRTLAQRSATAAREIKVLIEQSVETVDGGARLVAEAGQTMQEIVGQVRRVSDLVGEISSASRDQARGIEQVGQAMTQLDQVTQQNAALVEESAAAADSMRQQALRLSESVGVFKVDAQRAAPAA